MSYRKNTYICPVQKTLRHVISTVIGLLSGSSVIFSYKDTTLRNLQKFGFSYKR